MSSQRFHPIKFFQDKLKRSFIDLLFKNSLGCSNIDVLLIIYTYIIYIIRHISIPAHFECCKTLTIINTYTIIRCNDSTSIFVHDDTRHGFPRHSIVLCQAMDGIYFRFRMQSRDAAPQQEQKSIYLFHIQILQFWHKDNINILASQQKI